MHIILVIISLAAQFSCGPVYVGRAMLSSHVQYMYVPLRAFFSGRLIARIINSLTQDTVTDWLFYGRHYVTSWSLVKVN